MRYKTFKIKNPKYIWLAFNVFSVTSETSEQTSKRKFALGLKNMLTFGEMVNQFNSGYVIGHEMSRGMSANVRVYSCAKRIKPCAKLTKLLKGEARRQVDETNGWKIKNATGRFLVQIHPSCFVSKVVWPVPLFWLAWMIQFRSKLAAWNREVNTYYVITEKANVGKNVSEKKVSQ